MTSSWSMIGVALMGCLAVALGKGPVFDYSNDFPGPWVRHNDPCSLYRCPTNHVCYKGGMRGNSLYRPWMIRAMCHPVSPVACAANPCMEGEVCQTTYYACAKDMTTHEWCKMPYICMSEEEWYEGKTPIVKAH